MAIKQYVVDAFTDKLFSGNQAAVCVLDQWIPDELMRSIAIENNFSETAFTVRGGEKWHLRWFTPGGEIDFCGHATLGTSYVLFNHYVQNDSKIVFSTMHGDFPVTREGDLYVMDFPAYACHEVPVTDEMEQALGVRPLAAYHDRDLLCVLDNEQQVRNLRPDMAKVEALGGALVAVTAPSDEPLACHCVSRCFALRLAIPEDPVTGSTHCMIAPYWAKRLGKNELLCYQASKRGGTLHARVAGERVSIAGSVVPYSVAELTV